jgi:hypothetical protein
MFRTSTIEQSARRSAAGTASMAHSNRLGRDMWRCLVVLATLAAAACGGTEEVDKTASAFRAAIGAATAGDSSRSDEFTCTGEARRQIRRYAVTEPALLRALARATPHARSGFTRGDTLYRAFRTRYGYGQEVVLVAFTGEHQRMVCGLFVGDRFR